MPMPNLLEVRDLSKRFSSSGGPFRKARSMHAVNACQLRSAQGRVIGVVGESGCGKSTLARLILRLIEPSGGAVNFDGDDLLAKSPSQMRRLRARMQMVFQDPYSAIDPRYTLTRAVAEPFEVQGVKPKTDRRRGGGPAGNGRPQSRPCRQLSAPDFRRPEATGGHCPRACAAGPRCWCWMSRRPRLMCPYRRRSSGCWKTCGRTGPDLSVHFP
jgi:ABC-type glutathione transport system ATPase component